MEEDGQSEDFERKTNDEESEFDEDSYSSEEEDSTPEVAFDKISLRQIPILNLDTNRKMKKSTRFTWKTLISGKNHGTKISTIIEDKIQP